VHYVAEQAYAGNTEIEDIGTRFRVRRSPGHTDVVVAEGHVRIEGVELGAGEAASISTGKASRSMAMRKLSQQHVTEALAWTDGWLVLTGMTLEAAVSELNRYHRRRLVIADPSITSLRLGGRIPTKNLDDFGAALRPLGVRMVESDDKESILLVKKP
jgi:transmembrane sensor